VIEHKPYWEVIEKLDRTERDLLVSTENDQMQQEIIKDLEKKYRRNDKLLRETKRLL